MLDIIAAYMLGIDQNLPDRYKTKDEYREEHLEIREGSEPDTTQHH